MSTFGNNLRALRERKKVTQSALAACLNEQYTTAKFSRDKIARWENDIAIAPSTQLLILCDFFRVTLTQILPGEVKETVKNAKLEKIVAATSNYFDISEEKLLTENVEQVVYMRWCAFYLTKEHTTLNERQIGERFKKSRSSVLNGIESITIRKKFDKSIANDLQQIETISTTIEIECANSTQKKTAVTNVLEQSYNLVLH